MKNPTVLTIVATTAALFTAASASAGTLTLDPAAASGTLDLSIQQIDFQLAPELATPPPPSQSLNISTRGDVGTGEDVLIGGFIVTGAQPKLVALRVLGPSLGIAGVVGILTDPILELHDGTGAVIATNDNWKDNSAEDQTIITDNGLDQFTDTTINDAESIIIATLDPGDYTGIVLGVGDTTGVALVEVYDLDTTTDGQLANISTRGNVGTGDAILDGGFILGPDTNGAAQIIVRGLGPSLADKGVGNVLADPTLEVHNEAGDVIASNDNWMDSPDADTIVANDLAPDDPAESALLLIPLPGEYTAIARGVNGTTGVGLVEIYNLGSSATPEIYGTAPDGSTLQWLCFTPSGSGSHSAVVIAHGGGFHTGSMNGCRQQGMDLSAAGFLCFSINYRLDDDVILNQPAVFNGRRTGIASDQIDDFKTAIRAARSDPRCNGKVYLLGGSAGASNAMVTAVTGTVGDDKPDGVICLSGGFDLTDYTGFPAANPPSIRPIVQDGEMYANVGRPAGSNPPPPPALTDPPLDPSYTVPMHAVSAVAQTIANVPPTLLVNGTVEFMPVHQVDVMITALQNAGTPTFTTYPATPSNYQKNILPSDKHSWDNWLLPVATGSSVLVKDEVIEFLHRIDS